jgi:hypothetical protein
MSQARVLYLKTLSNWWGISDFSKWIPQRTVQMTYTKEKKTELINSFQMIN